MKKKAGEEEVVKAIQAIKSRFVAQPEGIAKAGIAVASWGSSVYLAKQIIHAGGDVAGWVNKKVDEEHNAIVKGDVGGVVTNPLTYLNPITGLTMVGFSGASWMSQHLNAVNPSPPISGAGTADKTLDPGPSSSSSGMSEAEKARRREYEEWKWAVITGSLATGAMVFAGDTLLDVLSGGIGKAGAALAVL